MDRRAIETEGLPPEYAGLLEDERIGKLIEPSYIARLFGLRRQRVYDLINLGELTGFRVGPRRLRVTRESLIEWVKRGGCAGRTAGKLTQ
ncbi:helix-turn-helix domain-containing protein [bacterium]|nr:helix-turn-helix domain-containing protein [bacterium]